MDFNKFIQSKEYQRTKLLLQEKQDFMSIIGIEKKEIRHSNFIAWLLKPSETHNLGNLFIYEFIKLVNTISGKHIIANYTFEDVVIWREYKNIDIFIVSPVAKLVIVIENKILANESDGQLNKYHSYIENSYSNYEKVYVYLTLFGKEVGVNAISNEWIKISYIQLIDILNNILKNNILNKNIETILYNYIYTIRNLIIDVDEDFDLALKDLYHVHYEFIDELLFNPQSTSLIKQQLFSQDNLSKRILDLIITSFGFNAYQSTIDDYNNYLFKKETRFSGMAEWINSQFRKDKRFSIYHQTIPTDIIKRKIDIINKGFVNGLHNPNIISCIKNINSKSISIDFNIYSEKLIKLLISQNLYIEELEILQDGNACIKNVIISSKEYNGHIANHDIDIKKIIKERYDKIMYNFFNDFMETILALIDKYHPDGQDLKS